MLYQTFGKTFRRAIQGVNKSRTYPCDVRPSLIGNLQHKEGLLGRLVVIAEGDEGRQLPFTESCVGVRHNTSSVIGSSRRLLLCFFFYPFPPISRKRFAKKDDTEGPDTGAKTGFSYIVSFFRSENSEQSRPSRHCNSSPYVLDDNRTNLRAFLPDSTPFQAPSDAVAGRDNLYVKIWTQRKEPVLYGLTAIFFYIFIFWNAGTTENISRLKILTCPTHPPLDSVKLSTDPFVCRGVVSN